MKEINIQNTIRIFWKHTLVYKWAACAVLVFAILRTGLETITPFLSKHFFDILAVGDITAERAEMLVHILISIAAVGLLTWASARLRSFASIRVQTHVMKNLRETAFSYLLQHSYRFFTNSFAGSLVRRVNRLSKSYEVVADELIYNLIPLAITIVVSLVAIASRESVIGFALLVWTVVFITVNIFAARWKQPYELKRAEQDSNVTGVLADSIGNTMTTKLFAGRLHEESLYTSALKKWRSIIGFTWNLNELLDGVQALLIVTINFIVMYLAVQFWKDGLLTVGDFVLIQSFLLSLFHQLWSIGRVFRHLYESFADAQEMIDILNMPHEVQDHPRATELSIQNAEIIFDAVTFSFHKTRKILKDFDLTISSGEKIALVGPSGAGKSTITQLLLRFYDIDKGTITIDGQNIARVSQDSLRDNIAFVPQEPILFHRTLMENIRYGRRDARDEEVIEAAKKAHCHEFIKELPEQYDTYVGERGVKLSGGERQRVAIARAILKDAPILVLDEATSSLDSESELFIQEALTELMEGKTTVVIAHRLSTIMRMDRIVVIDDGRVVTAGTHEELLEGDSIYRKLWEIQAGGFLE